MLLTCEKVIPARRENFLAFIWGMDKPTTEGSKSFTSFGAFQAASQKALESRSFSSFEYLYFSSE
jgi:hypothetical protein